MVDDRLHDGQRRRDRPGPVVLERADERRRSREPARGERAADLEFRIRSRLDPPEQLQHASCPGRADRQPAVRLRGCSSRPARLPQRRRDLLFAGDEGDQSDRSVSVVFRPVDDRALARAGDPREHRARHLLQRPFGVLAGEQGERHDVASRCRRRRLRP